MLRSDLWRLCDSSDVRHGSPVKLVNYRPHMSFRAYRKRVEGDDKGEGKEEMRMKELQLPLTNTACSKD